MSAKQNKGLGTGLGALFGGDEFSEEESELLYLPISKVEPRLEQPREYFDEEALQELAESITQYGLIQPITVRKLDSGYYQILTEGVNLRKYLQIWEYLDNRKKNV